MEYGTYFIFTALSAGIGCAVSVPYLRRLGLKTAAAAALLCCTLLLAALGARLYVILCMDIPAGLAPASVLSPRPYDYAVCGAVLGVLFAAAAASRVLHLPVGRAADALAPGGMAALALERISEVFADSAWGSEVLDERWQFFPVALRDGWGDFYYAVNLAEAALTLAVFFAFFARRGRRDGSRAALMLLWWSAGQILCESLRAETLRWGFVRVQQVQCTVFAAAVLLWALGKMKAPGRTWAAAWGICLLCIGAVVALEFALDKADWPRALDYALMALSLFALGLTVHNAVRRADAA